MHHGRHLVHVAEHAPANEDDVGDEKQEEDRHQHQHRLFDAAQIQKDEQDDDADLDEQAGVVPAGRQKLKTASAPDAIDVVMVRT